MKAEERVVVSSNKNQSLKLLCASVNKGPHTDMISAMALYETRERRSDFIRRIHDMQPLG